jgi:nitrite reductase/ring-hydroxylating ferredoxin subunit
MTDNVRPSKKVHRTLNRSEVAVVTQLTLSTRNDGGRTVDNLPTLGRRALITNGGVAALGVGVLALAGCAPSPTSPGGTTGSGQLEAGTELAKLADIPVGGTASAKVDGAPIVLAQPTEGKVVAFSAICTHQGCTVAAVQTSYDCPCHGSRYDAATGAVINGPAQEPLAKIDVEVVDGAVVTS